MADDWRLGANNGVQGLQDKNIINVVTVAADSVCYVAMGL